MSEIPKIAIHPTGKEISFLEENHEYLSEGIRYTSVSTIIKNLFPEFDSETIAERVAERRQVPTVEVLTEWANLAEIASTHGKKVHLYLENSFKNIPNEGLVIQEKTRLLLDKIILEIKSKYEIIEPEKIVFSPKTKIAGTIDLFGKRKNCEEYVLIDWKTNKEIDIENTYQKFGLEVFSGVPDTKFDRYSLQLSFYRELMIKEGYIPKNSKVTCIITHIPSSMEGYFKNYLAKDYSFEIKKVMKKKK